jgi:hypothetical protein
MQSLSNEPPTKDVTLKYNSPTSKNMKSNIVSSSSRNHQMSAEKALTEVKTSKKKNIYKNKKDNINNNDDDGNLINFNDTSLYLNLSDNNTNNNIYNENKLINKLIKNENNIKKEKSKHFNSNNNDNIINFVNSESSLGSYRQNGTKFPYIVKDYYSSMLDKYRYKKRDQLIQNSINFYLHQQKFLSKSSNFKKKEYIFDFSKKNEKIFSELKRVRPNIAFGKIIPKESVINKKRKKLLLLKPHKVLSHNKQTKNIFRKGLVNNNSVQKLKELKFIKDDYTTNNPNKKEYEPKDPFGNIVYPVFVQKRMLKNIMPKEYDYNTLRSPVELLNDTYHPLLRLQKKNVKSAHKCN